MRESVSKYAVISTFAVLLLSLYPQAALWTSVGSAWNGSYFVSNYDETAYSAYAAALIRGEPRKTDPFLRQQDSPETPQAETLYSIQFIPAYAVALPARLFGLSVSSAFIILIGLAAIFSTLALFWLIRDATGDEALASAGALVVLCFGTAAAFQGELRYIFEGRVLADFFPYLRRYQPGFAFPIFFLFCGLANRAVRSESARNSIAYAAGSGVLFVILVYSYFYLWTAAAAWIVLFTAFSAFSNRSDRTKCLRLLAVAGVAGIAALAPYFYLLSLRSQHLDDVQLLTYTRAPEFASPSMIIGLVIAAILLLAVRPGTQMFADRRVPLIFSCALTPVLLFNQQVLTGRSLQPVHYELFIANYLVLVAAVLLLSLLSEKRGTASIGFRRALAYLGVAAVGWGAVEAYTATSRNLLAAEIRDGSIPAVQYASNEKQNAVILATNFITSDFIPSVAPARALWSPHISSSGGIGPEENKRLFYLYLYYSGFGETDLEKELRANSFEVTAAIFGSERALPLLGSSKIAISPNEILDEVSKYKEFALRIDKAKAADPMLDFIVVPAEAEPTFENIDRWYNRDAGHPFGLFKVYKLELKPGG